MFSPVAPTDAAPVYANIGTFTLAILAGFAVGLATILAVRIVHQVRQKEVLALLPRYSPGVSQRDKTPADSRSWTARSVFREYQNWLRAQLDNLGFRGARAMRAEWLRKAGYAGAGLVLGALVLTRLWLPLLPVLFGVAGFFLPDYLRVRSIRKRASDLERALPDALDLLTLCIRAGLGLEQAMGRVSLSLDGPVAEEFGVLVSQLQLGFSRTEALQQSANRTRSTEFRRFLNALIQADRLGVPIATMLEEQANRLRAVRRDLAREQGQKVTVKILFPLMLCLLPAMFIVVLGPAVLQLVKTMSLL